MSAPTLDRLDRTVLELVAQGHGYRGWHELATRLSALDVPRQPDLMTVLGRLQSRGLVVRIPRQAGSDHWAVTGQGVAALRAPTPLEPVAGPLAPAEAESLARALAAGPMQVIEAIRPLIDDVPRLAAALRQILAGLPRTGAMPEGVPEGVADAARYLSESARGALARAMMDHPRPEVRRALLATWTPPRLEVQGSGWRCLPETEWDELLGRGLSDPDPEVRRHATALVFATGRADATRELLLANLRATDPLLRQLTLLALGSPTDPV